MIYLKIFHCSVSMKNGIRTTIFLFYFIIIFTYKEQNLLIQKMLNRLISTYYSRCYMASFNNFQLGFISEYIFLLHYFNIFFCDSTTMCRCADYEAICFKYYRRRLQIFFQITTTCLTNVTPKLIAMTYQL